MHHDSDDLVHCISMPERISIVVSSSRGSSQHDRKESSMSVLSETDLPPSSSSATSCGLDGLASSLHYVCKDVLHIQSEQDPLGRRLSDSTLSMTSLQENLTPRTTIHALGSRDNTPNLKQTCATFGMGMPSFTAYGAASDQGTRHTMEDVHVSCVRPHWALFGIYDGHGGKECAQFVGERLHETILDHGQVDVDPEYAITDAVGQVEKDFLDRCASSSSASSGCVCAVVLVGHKKLVVGNVGDCEVVLARGGASQVLTTVHNPAHNAEEASRVVEAGGRLCGRRVGHPLLSPYVCSLAVSRAMGDAGFKLDQFTEGKPSGIIAEPHTCVVDMTEEDEFLIMACDGVWDVVTHTEAVQMSAAWIAEGLSAEQVADKLISEALFRGTRDNVTALVVFLRESEAPPSPRDDER